MKKLMMLTLMCGLSLFQIGCGPEEEAAAPAETPADTAADDAEGGSE